MRRPELYGSLLLITRGILYKKFSIGDILSLLGKCKSPGKWETVSINSVKICGITISQANLGRGEEAKDQ